MSEELQASGIDLEVSESNAIIEDVFAKEGKKKAEAKEVQTKAMERLGQSSKRNCDEGGGEPRRKKRRWQQCSRVPQRESKGAP